MRKYFASALALALTCAAFSGAAFAGPGGGGSEDKGKSENAPGQQKAESAPAAPAAKSEAPGQEKKATATTSASTKGKSANAPGQRKKAAVQTQDRPGARGQSESAHRHVILCHRTGSLSNPFVVINISERGLNGHLRHPRKNDNEDKILAGPSADIKPGDKMGFTKANCVPPAPPPAIAAVTTQAVTTTEAVTTQAAVLGVAAEIRREAAQKPTKAKARGGVLGAAAELRAVGERELPFTGLPLWIAGLVALALLTAGIGLRRATR